MHKSNCHIWLLKPLGFCLGIALSLIFSHLFMTNHIDDAGFGSHSSLGILSTNDIAMPELMRVTDENEMYLSHAQMKIGNVPVKFSAPKNRPQFISTELGIREKLFIGILSDTHSISSRGIAINRTLHHLVENFKLFAILPAGISIPHNLPVVSLLDDKVQLTSLLMLKYIEENFLTTYDWFFFASDSTYINQRRLDDLISSISITSYAMFGNPLTCEEAANGCTCNIHAGIILSQGVVGAMIEDIDWCMSNIWSSHNYVDVLQICLTHTAHRLNISCISELKFNEVRYISVSNLAQNSTSHLQKSLSEFSQSVGNIVTVQHVNDDLEIYKIHRNVCEALIRETRERIVDDQLNILTLVPFTPDGISGLTWPIGVESRSRPRTRFDIIRWECFNETHSFFADDFTNIKEHSADDRLDVIEVLSQAVKRLSNIRQIRYRLHRLLNGYRRFDAVRGMEYVLDLVLLSSASGELELSSNTESIERIHLMRTLGRAEVIPMPYVTEATKLNLILPVLPHEKNEMLSFMDSYANICMESGDNSSLSVIFVYENMEQKRDDVFAMLKSTIASYINRYPDKIKRVTWTEMKLSHWSEINLPYHVLDLLSRRLAPDSLLLYCTVDMELSLDFLNRVRMNTIMGWQVFFPIGFRSYRPDLIHEVRPFPTTIEVNQKSGWYNSRNFVHSSFYLSDYRYARRQMIISRASASNMDLFDMFIQFHKVHIFRSTEPALKLRFREQTCDAAQKYYAECLHTRHNGLAEKSRLAMLLFDYQLKLDQLQINVMNKQHVENVVHIKPDTVK